MLEIKFLKKIPIFSGLSSGKLGKVGGIIKEKVVEANEVILQEGKRGDRMYILLEGEVEISKVLVLKDTSAAMNRQDKSLIQLSSKDYAFFGEMAILDPRGIRSATVIALKRCRLGEIEHDDFIRLIQSDKEIGYTVARNIGAVLSARLDKANHDILRLTTALSLVLERQ